LARADSRLCVLWRDYQMCCRMRRLEIHIGIENYLELGMDRAWALLQGLLE
jgi:hypothetical protein